MKRNQWNDSGGSQRGGAKRDSGAKPGGAKGGGGPERGGKRGGGPKRDGGAKRVGVTERGGGHVPEEFTDATRGIRLQKVLAESGVASRRECERLIREGRVAVNGQPVTGLPAWVDPRRDHVEVEGRRVTTAGVAARAHSAGGGEHGERRGHVAGLIYVALHKPRGVISTTRDPEGRRTVTGLVDLPAHLAHRLFPVGRLDADSTGLILLTNDGELANRLTHPRYEVAKKYHVSIKGRLTIEDINRLRDGLYLAQPGAMGSTPGAVKKAALEQVTVLGEQRDRTRGDRTSLLVTLREGQNREIRRLFARLGFNVRRLQRVAIGPLSIKGLAAGQWRLLTGPEVAMLRRASRGEPGEHGSPTRPAGKGIDRSRPSRGVGNRSTGSTGRSGPPRPPARNGGQPS